MNPLLSTSSAGTRCFRSGKVTCAYLIGRTTRGGTKIRLGDDDTAATGLLGDERSGPEGARIHSLRNDRAPQTKRNYCRGTAAIRDQSSPATTRAVPLPPPPATTIADDSDTTVHSVGLPRHQHCATVSPPATSGIYYLPCGPVIIVCESPPTSAGHAGVTGYGLKISFKGQGETAERGDARKK